MVEEGTAAAAYVGYTVLRGYLETTLPFVVLGAGVWLLIATRAVQFRRLGRALKLATSRGGAQLGLAGMLAGSVGIGSIAAAALALETAGPGSIAWMWIVAILGMGVSWTEVTMSARLRGGDGATPGPMTAMRAALGRVGGVLAFFYAISLMVCVVAVGALFQTEQTSQFVRSLTPLRPEATALALALATAVLLLLWRSRLRAWAGRAILLSLGVYALAALIVIMGDASAAGAALGEIATTAFSSETIGAGLLSGGLVLVIQTAALRATLAQESGLGTHGLSATAEEEADAPEDPNRPALLAMLVPAVTTLLIGTLTALVVMLSGASQGERAAERLMLPLTQLERHAITASELGQSFTLPEHTRLKPKHRYRMKMLANPRGHKVGKMANDERTIGLPAWENTTTVDTLYFRYKDERAQHEAFDLAVPCNRELSEIAGVPWLKLIPKDPETNLRVLMRAKDLDGPYLRLADVEFPGIVRPSVRKGEADIENSVETPTLFEEPRTAESPHNPSLRTLVVMGYAGPYVAGEEHADAPWALIGAEGFEPEIGSIAHLRFLSPSRGLNVGYMSPLNELAMPPWEFLKSADRVIIRHRENPALDFSVPVTSEVRKDRLLFTSMASDFEFKQLRGMKDYEPRPFLVAPPYSMAVEVHSGERLPVEYRARRALIPLDEYSEPLPLGQHGLRRANPREILATPMAGPLINHDGAGVVASGFARKLPQPLAWILTISVLGMVVLTLRSWAHHGASAFASLLGDNGWVRAAFLAVFVLLVAVGASLPLHRIIEAADASLALTVQFHLVVLVLLTPHVFRAGREG